MNSEMEETLKNMFGLLDFDEIKIRITKAPEGHIGLIGFDRKKIKENKLYATLYMSEINDKNKLEKCVGHEIGHALMARDNPRLVKFFEYASYPFIFMMRNVCHKKPVYGMMAYGALAGIAGNLVNKLMGLGFYSYVDAALLTPMIATVVEEGVANYKARQKGMKSLNLLTTLFGIY